MSSLLLVGCASKQMADIDPNSPFSPAEQIILKDINSNFTAANYDNVIDKVNNTPEVSTGTLAFRSEALKYKAFSECLLEKTKDCASSFKKILKADPTFELADSEKNHPMWGKVFAKEKRMLTRKSTKAKSKKRAKRK